MARARAASSVSSPAVLALVLSAATAPRAVEATRAFVAYLGGEYGCMPQLHAEKTSPDSFHKPDASVVYMRLTGSGEEDACHGDAATYRAAFEDADVQAVAGRIALVRGSGCAFPAPSDPDADPLLLYARDFQARVDAAVEAGAVGVLWGEGAPGKHPSHVLAQRDAEHLEQAKPVCAMRRDAFDALLDAVGLDALPAGSYADGVDLTGAPMYRSSDETRARPRDDVHRRGRAVAPNGPDGFHYRAPARLATFNPDAIAARSAEMVRVAFRDECNALDYAACMASCWSATADPFATPVSGKVAVFARERAEDYACHNSFAEWAAVSVDAGAVAVLHASQSYDGYGWSFPGPYLVPFAVTAPFFALLKIHADALFEAEAESEAHSNHAVVVSTPALANREGPAFHAPREVVLGQTPLLFWKSERDHFFCDAGEAGFNPADFPGRARAPTYDDDDDADSSRLDSIRTNRVVRVTPSDACEAGTSRAATCGECLTQGPRAQAKSLWSLVDGELVTVAGGDPAAHAEAFGEDFVAALMVHEHDCFATYEEFARRAPRARARAPPRRSWCAVALPVRPVHLRHRGRRRRPGRRRGEGAHPDVHRDVGVLEPSRRRRRELPRRRPSLGRARLATHTPSRKPRGTTSAPTPSRCATPRCWSSAGPRPCAARAGPGTTGSVGCSRGRRRLTPTNTPRRAPTSSTRRPTRRVVPSTRAWRAIGWVRARRVVGRRVGAPPRGSLGGGTWTRGRLGRWTPGRSRGIWCTSTLGTWRAFGRTRTSSGTCSRRARWAFCSGTSRRMT